MESNAVMKGMQLDVARFKNINIRIDNNEYMILICNNKLSIHECKYKMKSLKFKIIHVRKIWHVKFQNFKFTDKKSSGRRKEVLCSVFI